MPRLWMRLVRSRFGRAAFIAGLVLFAWAYARPSLMPSVSLLTGDGGLRGGCYTSVATGVLVVDPTYGTALRADGYTSLLPVMWPNGYTGHREGDEVMVVNHFGLLVARTGHRYSIGGGGLPDEPHAFLACGSVRPWPLSRS